MRRPVLALALALLAIIPADAAHAAEPLLPDLTQETPFNLGVATDGRRYHLGFTSVVYNYGDGPLRIQGARSSRSDPTMTATQVIEMDDGTQQRVPRIGELRYVDAITHRHWHYLKFDTYSLRRTNGTVARPDQKTGFCLGDRLQAPDRGPLPAMPDFAVFGGVNCGFDRPDLLEVEEGISVGYGDDYPAQLEGQFVEITGLRSGRYVLVHRANADGAVREKTLANNAASVLVDVRTRGGVPRVTQVERCPASATCPVAPALSRARATRLARDAFERGFRRRAANVSCAEPAGGVATCSGTLPAGAATVTIRYSVRAGRLYWTFSATGGGSTRARRGRVGVSLGRARRVPVSRGISRARAARVAYCPLIARG